MPRFLTRRNTVSEIENILKNATKIIVLVSPYIKLTEDSAKRLRAADDRGVSITVVCRKDEIKDKDRRTLQKLKHIKIYSRANLHTKCYYNEKELIITSMNLYEYSEQNNVEMGILFTKDDPIYREARREVEEFLLVPEHKVSWTREKLSALARSTGKTITSGARAAASRATEVLTEKGHCIRCGDSIPLNPKQPLCKTCFPKWAKWKREDYPEKLCHRCGKEKDHISKSRPQCSTCYKARST